MFSPFRRVTEAIGDLAGVIRTTASMMAEIAERRDELAPFEGRLEELERSRAKWEAEIDAYLLKADSTLRSANNAESRARTMRKHDQSNADPFGDDREEVEAPVPEGYAPIGPEEELQPVHVGVEASPKEQRLRAKFQ